VIDGKLNPAQLEALQRRLGEVYGRARLAVDRGVRNSTLRLARYIQQNKLSGQSLDVRTGLLKRSLQPPLFESDEDTTTGIIGRTMPAYGKAWEAGFSGSVMVKAHQRMNAGKDPRMVAIAAHARNVNMRAKHFLADSVNERGEAIKQDIRRRVLEAVKL
jgi:hypothetical protein